MSHGSNENIQGLSSVDPSPIEEANERTTLLSDSESDLEDSELNSTFSRRTERLFANVSILVVTFIAAFWWVLTLVNLLVSFTFADPVRESGFLNIDLLFIGLMSIIIYTHYGLDPYSGTNTIQSNAGATPEQKVTWLTVSLLVLDFLIIIAVPGLRRRYTGQFYWIPLIAPFFLSALLLLLSLRRTRKRRISRVTWFTTVVISGLIRILVFLLVLAITVNIVREAILTKDGIKEFSLTSEPSSAAAAAAADSGDDYEYFVPIDDSTYNIYIRCTPPRPLNGKSNGVDKKNLTILIEPGDSAGSSIYSWLSQTDYSASSLASADISVRTCYYDHPGIEKSDNAPSPISAGGIADGLTQALTSTGIIEDDLLIVTHGIGAVYTQIFAARHIDSVVGLFIIDGLTTPQFLSLNAPSQGFVYFIKGLLTPFWSFKNGGYYKAKLQEEIAAKPLTKHEIAASELILHPSEIPLAVVSSSQMIKRYKTWSDNQRLLTDITHNNVLWSILEGPHEIWKNSKSKHKLVELIQDVVHYNLGK